MIITNVKHFDFSETDPTTDSLYDYYNDLRKRYGYHDKVANEYKEHPYLAPVIAAMRKAETANGLLKKKKKEKMEKEAFAWRIPGTAANKLHKAVQKDIAKPIKAGENAMEGWQNVNTDQYLSSKQKWKARKNRLKASRIGKATSAVKNYGKSKLKGLKKRIGGFIDEHADESKIG